MTEQATTCIDILVLEGSAPSERLGISCRTLACEGQSGSNLPSTFAATASEHALRPALTTSAGTWTYGQVLASVMEVCHHLQSRSTFRPGSRVAVALPNSLEYITAFYGVLLAGGVVVPIAPKMERRQLQAVIRATDAVQMITNARLARSLQNDLGAAHLETLARRGSPDPAETPDRRSPGANADSLAVILFTGGSSGTPKGVMLSHRNLIENARSIQQYLHIQHADRPLCVLPFYHAFGNSVLQSHLLAGSHLIIDGNTTFPETLVEAILKHQATSLSGVPDLFRFLLERASLESLRNSSLRYMAVAGGALPHDLSKSVADRIQPAQFCVMYGQTEATARLAYVPPERFPELGAGCIGRAVPGVEIQVVDETGTIVAPGAVGEIRARGPNIMMGYWQDSALTDETVRDGWLYTGDLGSVCPEGWIYHRGRRSALIKIAGYRIHPSDVEDFVLRELPIQQAVLVPYEHQELGTRLALYVRCSHESGRPTAPEIIARCRKELPRHMVPELVQFVDEFPLNDAMKIDRLRLIEMAAQAAPPWRTAV